MFLLLMAVFTTVYPMRQLHTGQVDLAHAHGELAAKLSERTALERRLAVLNTPQEVERLARERFGLARPGEIGYVIIDGDGGLTVTAPPR
jgi:cell division protein FtsB